MRPKEEYLGARCNRTNEYHAHWQSLVTTWVQGCAVDIVRTHTVGIAGMDVVNSESSFFTRAPFQSSLGTSACYASVSMRLSYGAGPMPVRVTTNTYAHASMLGSYDMSIS